MHDHILQIDQDPFADVLALDAEYVDRASFAFDLRIVWRTVVMVVRRHGVTADGHVTMHEFTGER